MGLKEMRESKATACRNEAKKYSVRALVAYLGIGIHSYYRLEQDPKYMDESTANKLAEYFDCSPETFLFTE